MTTTTAPTSGGDADRSFRFTLAAVAAIVVLGLVVVPLSIPDAAPAPSRSHVLAEQYLTAFSDPSSPTAKLKLAPPSVAKVRAEYGTTGGDACTAGNAKLYATLLDGAAFDGKGYATTRVAQSVYCPDRSTSFTQYVTHENAKRRAARAAAAADAAA